jgi:glycosyltransferase involved in cell wall biosynthesis
MNLLVVTYYYPPNPGSGGVRWEALSKYLRRMGHTVTVLTRGGPNTEHGDSGDVVHVPDLDSSPILRRVLRRPPLTSSSSQPTYAKAPPALLTKVLVPDAHLLSWNPQALRIARRIVHERSIDCVITSSPPDSTHLIGLALGRRRPAWIADLRDGWLFEPLRDPFPTSFQRALDRRLERAIASRADCVTAATMPIVEDLRARLGAPAQLLSNGWDPHDEPEQTAFDPADSDKRFTLLHTGTLSGSWGRDPSALLNALRNLIDQEPELAGRLRLLLVGRLDRREREMVRDARLDDVVTHAGFVPREQARALQRSADVLLLITSRKRGEATGKLYEYLAARRPILALAEGNEAARIVQETRTGVTVAPDDVDMIAAAIRHAMTGEMSRTYSPQNVERYTYPRLAEGLAELIERVVRRRAEHR